MDWRVKISKDINFKGYTPQTVTFSELNFPDEVGISNEEYDSFSASQREDYIFNYLRQNSDFNDVQISGIVACLINESGLNRTIENQMEADKWKNKPYKSGKGIAQWSLDRNLNFSEWMEENYGEAAFPNEVTINQQLEFMLFEMSQRPAFLKAIAAATTPEQAADAMRRGFENGSANSLATKKQMDGYIAVGSPGANAIYAKDAKQANRLYSRMTLVTVAKNGIKLLIK